MSFSERNKLRCEAANGFNHKLDSWSLSDWMTATLGELGEAANIIKKLNRVRDGIPGNKETPEQLKTELAMELADAAIYLDLLVQAAGFDMVAIRNAKFAITSAKLGYDADLADEGREQLEGFNCSAGFAPGLSRSEQADLQSYDDLAASGGIVDAP